MLQTRPTFGFFNYRSDPVPTPFFGVGILREFRYR